MGTLLGFALGFYLGARTGPERLDELVKAWQTIRESEDFKALSATAQATVQSFIEQAGASAANVLATLIGARRESEDERARRAAGRNGAQGLWTAVAQSADVQGVVSTAAALVIQLLERGISAAQQRS
jgi:hypothetical protein